MKKPMLVITLLLTMMMANLRMANPALAQAQIPGIVGQVISLLGGSRADVEPQPADERQQVLYGSEISITNPVKGDLIAAGGRITIDAPVAGDLIVAGGLVQVNAPVSGDIIGVGGLINLAAKVDNDVRVAAIGVNLENTITKNAMVTTVFLRQAARSSINGSLTSAAFRAWLNGVVNGNLTMRANNVALDAAVGGTVTMTADQLTIQKNATVLENVNATLTTQPSIDAGAQLKGLVDINVPVVASPSATATDSATPTSDNQTQSLLPSLVGTVYAADGSIKVAAVDKAQVEATEQFNKKASTFFNGILITLVGGSLLLWLFPTFQNGQVQVLQKKTALVAVAGWMWIFVGLIAIVLLLVSIIGAPLGIALLFVWLATWIMAPWAVAQALGGLISRKWQQESPVLASKYFHLLVGATIIGLLMLLPVFGWLVRLIVWTLGMGAPLYWLLNKPEKTVELQALNTTPVVVTETIVIAPAKKSPSKRASKKSTTKSKK